MRQNEVKETEEYKLYKSVREILHPAISKRNISNYKIILKEELLPIKVFYPRKVTNIDKVIIYVQGCSKIMNPEVGYSKILTSISKDLDSVIISINYNENDLLKKQLTSITKTLEYILDGLKTNGIEENNISLMGDSTGSTIILNILNNIRMDHKKVKLILFYPALLDSNAKSNTSPIDFEIISGLVDYYQSIMEKKNFTISDIFKQEINSIPSTTIICGNVDPLLENVKTIVNKSSNIKLKLISFASHNFLNSKDKEIKKEYKRILLESI